MQPLHDRGRRRLTRRRRSMGIVAAASAALLLAAGCGGDDDGFDEAAGTDGGTLTIATSSDILSMDPAMHRNRVNQSVVRNVFDGLVNQDDDLKPVPELATSWEQPDDLTWRFHLREDVEFHNGEAFDAEDVKFSIERVLDPEQKSPRASMLSMVDSVEVEDPYTVTITTKEPSPTLLASLSVNEIVPKDYVTEVGDAEFAKKPVGTGPFTFEEWVPNDRVVLNANSSYWGGSPKVDSLVFRPVPEVSARVAALQAGDVDIASEIPPDLATGLGDKAEAVSVDGTRIFFLAMNVTKEPFSSKDARVGANHALDKEALVNDLLGGYARELNQPAFPEMVGYHEGYEGYAYDPAEAKELLAGSAPVRIDAEEKDKVLAEAVAGQLSAAGLKATVNILETEAFTQSIESGESQAYLSSWGVAEGDADVIYARHFWSPSREGAVYTGYSNPSLDTLIAQGRSTTDADERTGVYAEATEIVMADAPWVPILNPQEIYGVADRVEGFAPSPIGRYNVAGTSLTG